MFYSGVVYYFAQFQIMTRILISWCKQYAIIAPTRAEDFLTGIPLQGSNLPDGSVLVCNDEDRYQSVTPAESDPFCFGQIFRNWGGTIKMSPRRW